MSQSTSASPSSVTVPAEGGATTQPAVSTPQGPPVVPARATRRPARLGARLRALLRSPSAVVGLAVTLLWVLCAIFWPLLVRYDPNAPDYNAGNLARPSAAHLFGTDQLGRDVLTRVMAGSREVLLTAPIATALGLLGGILVGLVTSYYRGWVDEIIMRLMDVIMAFPTVVLALLILAVLGSSRLNVILVIAIAYVPLTARVVRAAALTVCDLDYVSAARLRGARGPVIMLTEILPNIMGPIIVEGTVRVGYAIFATASLGFIGLGLPPPSPDWGTMINETRINIQVAPLIVLAPALAIASLVVAINLLAEGLRRAEEV